MIKSVTVPITVNKEIIESYICDKCKREYKDDDIFEVQEFHHIQFTGGYGSVFGDSSNVECDLCQYCLYELIGLFADIK
jgi:hypothetical protein